MCGPPIVEGTKLKRTIASMYTGGDPCMPQNVSTKPKISVAVDAVSLGNKTFRFTCDPIGFKAKKISWSFGDLQSMIDAKKTVTHTYPKPNTFTASCTATNGQRAATGIVTVTVT
jgi:PKD repeat protein